MRKILVCGMPNFKDRQFLYKKLDKLTNKLEKFELHHSDYKEGPPKLCDEWAVARFPRKIIRKIYYTEWKKHSRNAPLLRNDEMIEAIGPKGVCVGFLTKGIDVDGASDLIKRARKKKLKVIVYQTGGK